MGNRNSSGDFVAELYKWSSAEFHKEYTFIYKSVTDESVFSIFRLSEEPKRMLLRLGDCMCECDEKAALRLHMEVIAERDNIGSFNYRLGRVVTSGTTNFQSSLQDNVSFCFGSSCVECERRRCFYSVKLPEQNCNTGKNMSLKVEHTFDVAKTHMNFFVDIECNKVTGLSAKFRGPFKLKYPFSLEQYMQLNRAAPQIQRQVHAEPPKDFNVFFKSEFEGEEFILFKRQGKGSTITQAPSGQATTVQIDNYGATFNGNAIFYEIMQLWVALELVELLQYLPLKFEGNDNLAVVLGVADYFRADHPVRVHVEFTARFLLLTSEPLWEVSHRHHFVLESNDLTLACITALPNIRFFKKYIVHSFISNSIETSLHIKAAVDTMFTGRQYILFKQGTGNTATTPEDQQPKIVINNS
ncbi:hypothetical protein VNO78_27717 [Psophocarpus tetragonolobus]|uniref:Uncharacterized protein n=1 Tax=Psophocarpus tetragonolobus TaxID=3891 RepID=A0AAN9XAE3_PSOTE